MNFHFPVVNFLNLTLEDVKSNSGPSRFRFSSDYSNSVGSNRWAGFRNVAINKSIQASHHQVHLKYRESAGMQSTSNAYFSIAYSVIKKPSIWKSWNLDYILEQGHILFKCPGIGQPLTVDELPFNFKIENSHLNGVMINMRAIWCKTKITFLKITGILLKETLMMVQFLYVLVSVWRYDSHSRNGQGFHDSNEKAILLEFRSMLFLNNILKTFFYWKCWCFTRNTIWFAATFN